MISSVLRLLTRHAVSKQILLLFSLLFISIFLLAGQSPAADATQTTVTLTWTAPGDDGESGTASEYDIRYSLSPITGVNWDAATQVDGEPTPSLAGTLETFTVTDLQPGTTYYFAVKAADEVPNWSVISNVIAVTTLTGDVPPAAVTTLTAAANTSSSVRLLWTAPGEDGNVGTAATYDIRYSQATITEANWASATAASGEPAPSVAGSTESVWVEGLDSGVRYYFAIKTADGAGNWSLLSNVVSTVTGSEQTAPADIINLAVTETAENTVTLSWTAPGDDGSTGTAAQYDVRYAIWPITNLNWYAAASAPNIPTPQAAGGTESFTVGGLQSGATYYFAIKTADEVPNWSGLSNLVSGTTGDNIAPAQIADLAAEAGADAGELVLSWTAPGDDGTTGFLNHYIIAYSTDTLTAANWQLAGLWPNPPTPVMGGQVQTFTLTGLEEATEYWVVVVGVDEADNNSGLSNIASGESGFEFGLGMDDDDNPGLPDEFELSQNYPNPFNPQTTIEFSVPTTSEVTIVVYNVLGQPTATLVDETLSAGIHSVVWDGKDSNGTSVATGIYFYTIQAENFRATRKMVLLQ